MWRKPNSTPSFDIRELSLLSYTEKLNHPLTQTANPLYFFPLGFLNDKNLTKVVKENEILSDLRVV